MARESAVARRARVGRLVVALEQTHPDAHCELNYSNPLELLVATILSAQCTDVRVNAVTADLFRRYRNAADYAAAPTPELEAAIKPTGFFRNKARSIQTCCRQLLERHNGQVPETMETLIQLEGVGRKTANVVLGNAFGRNEGIVVDTHVARLSRRLGLTQQTQPEKIERELMPLVAREQWTMFSHWLIWHGRRRCGARRPDCGACEIADLCPRVGVGRSHEPSPQPSRVRREREPVAAARDPRAKVQGQGSGSSPDSRQRRIEAASGDGGKSPHDG